MGYCFLVLIHDQQCVTSDCCGKVLPQQNAAIYRHWLYGQLHETGPLLC